MLTELLLSELKNDLAAAYKESELVRQRSRSLEEELSAARRCSADLADQLQRRIGTCYVTSDIYMRFCFFLKLYDTRIELIGLGNKSRSICL